MTRWIHRYMIAVCVATCVMIWVLAAVACWGAEVEAATPGDGLAAAASTFPGTLMGRSERHPTLDQLAQGHAETMARLCQQGHQGWNARFARCLAKFGPTAKPKEICAESWLWQWRLSPPELGTEMFACWKKSTGGRDTGHWAVAKRQHKYVGYGMARGRNKIWYACIIVVD